MDDKITLDRDTFKALAVDTRVEILKRLDDHKATLTDLTSDLSMSPSTVKEHLDKLLAAGLIEQEPSEAKWKYYRLTRKGKSVVHPRETAVWVLLGISAFMGLLWTFRLIGRIQGLAMQSFSDIQPPGWGGVGVNTIADEAPRVMTTAVGNASEVAYEVVAGSLNASDTLAGAPAPMLRAVAPAVENASEKVKEAATLAVQNVSDTYQHVAQTGVAGHIPSIPYVDVAAIIILTLVAGACVGYLIGSRRRLKV
ncbi:Putative arsenical resistance operon repressor ArsR2 [uncultured archaeon]|nr:Putative arsenical resistance operon repressor ArsR2 [uncultured archaeon]